MKYADAERIVVADQIFINMSVFQKNLNCIFYYHRKCSVGASLPSSNKHVIILGRQAWLKTKHSKKLLELSRYPS
jgi:hypothetical protein